MSLLNSFSRKHFYFFDFTALFTHTTPELVLEIAVLGPKFCPACEWCSFTIHLASHSRGPHTVSLQSHGLIVRIKPSCIAGKYIFYDANDCEYN